ncbi:hypothetical protein NDU88_004995 [Pleurodeles waltl]|uniref:Uncharacterized protein n=1 Tax=Pleurodeles waltl TaxID=8319 RepID=A0AAV7RMI6_PLEWA|nr:hypothetical protein NDU88_004995 [Pleurodeles waltl]
MDSHDVMLRDIPNMLAAIHAENNALRHNIAALQEHIAQKKDVWYTKPPPTHEKPGLVMKPASFQPSGGAAVVSNTAPAT